MGKMWFQDALTLRRRQRARAALAAAMFLLAAGLGPALAAENKYGVAVIIGNKDYGDRIPAVKFADNDAGAIKRYVIDVLGYREGNVIFLRNATKAQIETVFGTKETPQGKLFDWLRPGKSDVTVFYSGHGVPGLRDRRGYFLPVDGDPDRAEITGYPLDLLYRNLGELPARSITVFLDTCFSGESAKGMVVRATSGISVTAKPARAPGNLTVLTAARGDQVASWDEDAKHGLFTEHLLRALYGKADGKDYGDGDGKVTLAEVRDYLSDEMSYQARRRYGRRQTTTIIGKEDVVLVDFEGGPYPKRQRQAAVAAPPKPAAPSPVKPAAGVYFRPGDTFKDCAECPEMVVAPAGSFRMGDLSGDGDSDEKPLHTVSIPNKFAVGKFEVTFAEWHACVVSAGGCGHAPKDEGWGRGRRPVINVSWNDAKQYVRWLSDKT
ncbi:MAG: caspase family protein, partial [Phycisphaerae bacterium]|nr:caspase family protein [Phycisphaerae bacterium]